MHSILDRREDRDLNQIQCCMKNDNESSDKGDNFKYDSDPGYDTIDFSNWYLKKDVKKSDRTRNDTDGNGYDDNDNEVEGILRF